MPYLAGLRAFVSSVTGVVILALLAALMIQTVRIEGFKVWPISIHGLKAELANAKGKLKAISDKRNEQRPITETNVSKARQSDQSAKRVSERIRNAPVKACETGAEILSADI